VCAASDVLAKGLHVQQWVVMVDCADSDAHFLLLLMLQVTMAGGSRCHAEPRVVAEAGVMTGVVTGAVGTTGVTTTGAHLVAAGER
jgi:hypothetical protein